MKTDRRILSSSLSSRIIAYLLQKGRSQADIAQMLGVSQGFVSLIKTRERGLTLDHIERLADAMSLPVGEFMLVATAPAKGTKYPKKLYASSVRVIRLADKARAAILGSVATNGRKAHANNR